MKSKWIAEETDQSKFNRLLGSSSGAGKDFEFSPNPAAK